MSDSTIEGRKHLVQAYVVSIVALIICVLLNAYNELDLCYSIVILFIFLVLIIIGYKDADGNSIVLTRNGESIYFLGYLTTIVALMVSAFKIHSNPDLLNDLAGLLVKGAFAITSTVGGLIGMFVLRIMAHQFGPSDREGDQAYTTSQEMQAAVMEFSKKSNEYLDTLRNNTGQVISQLSQLGSENAVALDESFRKIERLGASVENMTENVTRIVGNLEVLEKSSLGAGAALAEVAVNATTIQGVATKLDQVSNDMLPAWQQVTDHVKATANLTQKITDLGQIVEYLQVGFGTCHEEMKKFTEMFKENERFLLETLENVQRRAKDVGDVSEGVIKFTDAAKSIVPVVNAISENLSEVVSIHDAVKLVRTNLQNLNEALVNSANVTGLISENSQKLTINVSDLVTEINNQFHKLGQSAQTLGKFTSTMVVIEPQLETVRNSIASLGGFGTEVSGVKKSLDELKMAAEQTSLQMHGLDKFIASFLTAVDTLLAKRGPSLGPPGR